ncbi:SusD/RagB family nutrient-binding outer membrane lipoprotein [Mucilaginibacter sp. L196]|uniref:SusD/RagB family nutrient-binding outer membrane lipoprotein n=1 Tax=Mucilaginibacter sp. L196 TaxID=1641870 RepID=UPI00131D7EFE|nr:SusD/RagB family nutrient-binding outer membrane lipoprotein [Mucilaginibacter sp. L196]
MKKTALIFVLVGLLSACTKNLTKLNVDPKNPLTVPSYTLFTNAERVMSTEIITPNINDNTFRLIEQQWTETQYLNETQYDIQDRKIPDNIYSIFFSGALNNFELAKKTMLTDVTDAPTRANETAITDLCEVYSFYYLVTTFGNIPYTEAFQPSNPFPKFDDAATIYQDLLKRIDTDIAALNEANGTFGTGVDQIYAGDPNQWIKFANTLKIKLGMTVSTSTSLQAIGQTAVEAAAKASIFASNADNALQTYYSSPPSTNPTWVELIQSGRHDYVATDFFMKLLGSQNTATPVDPRTPYYFAENASGVYLGAPVATVVVAANYSLPSGPLYTTGSIGTMTNPDYPGDILDYSELQFNLAEAAARGYSVGGTAATFFKNAVDASIQFWTGSTTGAAAYDVLPAGNSAAQLLAIAQQEYISLYNRGWDAWTLTRKFGYPAFTPPPSAYSLFPVRFTYPVIEQNTNPINYKAAAAAIGGDAVTTKLVFFK